MTDFQPLSRDEFAVVEKLIEKIGVGGHGEWIVPAKLSRETIFRLLATAVAGAGRDDAALRVGLRQRFDALDAIIDLSDSAVFGERRALGKAVGAALDNATISAKTFPPYGELGAMTEPPPRATPEAVAPTVTDEGVRCVRCSRFHSGVAPDDSPTDTCEDCGKLALFERLRGRLLYYFGTTDPDLLTERWNEKAEARGAPTPATLRDEAEVGAWIATRMMERSLPNTDEAAKWRVLLAAFWDVTRKPYEGARRPDRPQWDIVSLRSALENWGRHHDWCPEAHRRRGTAIEGPCNCGLAEALTIGQYATPDLIGYGNGVPTPTLRAPEVTDDDEIWAAYRAGYLNGVSEPKAQIEGYEAWCAHAEAGATAYTTILNTPPNSNTARQRWLAEHRKGSATLELASEESGAPTVGYFVLDGDGTAIHSRPHVTLDAAEGEAAEERERRPHAPPPIILRCLIDRTETTGRQDAFGEIE